MSDTTVYSVVEFIGVNGRQYGHYTDQEIMTNTGKSFQLGDYDGRVYWMEDKAYYSMKICFTGLLEDALDRRAQLEDKELTPNQSIKRKEVKPSRATRKRRAALLKIAQLIEQEEKQLEDDSGVKKDEEKMDLEDNGVEKEENREDRENEGTGDQVELEQDDEVDNRPENKEDGIVQDPIVDAQLTLRQSTAAGANNRKRLARSTVDGETPKRGRKSDKHLGDIPDPRQIDQDRDRLIIEAKKKEEEEQRLAEAKAEQEKRHREEVEKERLAEERAEEEKRQRDLQNNGELDVPNGIAHLAEDGAFVDNYEAMNTLREGAMATVENKKMALDAVRAAFRAVEAKALDELEMAEKILQSANLHWAAVLAIHKEGKKEMKKKVEDIEKKARAALPKKAKKQTTAKEQGVKNQETSDATHQVDLPSDESVNEEHEKENGKKVPKNPVGKRKGTKDMTGDDKNEDGIYEKDSRKKDNGQLTGSAASDEKEEGNTVKAIGYNTPSNITSSMLTPSMSTPPAAAPFDFPEYVFNSPYCPAVENGAKND